MGLELVIFIGAILVGILVYWRESQSNALYRFFNKIFNSKALQMKPTDKKGFVFKQAFLPRLVYVVGIFLIIGLIVQFLTPFKIFTNYNGISAFSSVVVGVLIGTYVANFVLKSGKVIEEKADVVEDLVNDAVEKGKDLIEDITTKEVAADDVTPTKENVPESNTDNETKKSARERLKDKGYLK
ncbi:hypothetical protein FUA26_06505 [Seonamhaeicola algicola]|uniref:Uncharacterized protein n=1 Tax=Seonamhaeicola algicola TaxID=1719036 RepID=A0A5C7AYY6_9FLAO|nr:hypothetical protein [Seonamhaeicola algicola]TXE11715.1 hypothetical protein FUA26_06505 [Seonamhaeicola algicola]